MNANMGAYGEEHLEKLASKPNTTVFKATYDEERDAWSVARLKPVIEKIAAKTLSIKDESDQFRIRKRVLDELDDTEVRDFQRTHSELFWTLTDPTLMQDETYRSAVTAMISVRCQVENGTIPAGKAADAAATQAIMAALRT